MASGTVLPFSAISGRSIAILPLSVALPPVNFAISASASAGVAMLSSTATSVSVIPAPSSKALRRVTEDIVGYSLGRRHITYGLVISRVIRGLAKTAQLCADVSKRNATVAGLLRYLRC